MGGDNGFVRYIVTHNGFVRCSYRNGKGFNGGRKIKRLPTITDSTFWYGASAQVLADASEVSATCKHG